MPSSSEERELLRQRLSRRRLLKAGAAAAIGAAGLSLAACASEDNAEFVSGGPPATVCWRRWFGPASAPGKVQWDGQLETLGAAAPDKTTVPLTGVGGVNDGSCFAQDVQRAYFSFVSIPFRLVRYNPADNTFTTYTAPTGYNNAWGVCTTGGKVYVPSTNPLGAGHFSVSVFNTGGALPDTFEDVHDYDGTLGSGAIATDGTYLYIGGEGEIHMVRLSDMALVDTLTLTHYIGAHAIGYNTTDGFLYGGDTNIATKISIDRTEDAETLTETAHYHHNCGPTTDDLAFSSTHLWLGPENGTIYGKVLLIPLSTFDSHTLVTLGPTAAAEHGYCEGSFMDWDGLHMWTAWGSHPVGQLTRTKLSDMTSERIWLASGENWVNEVIQYDTNKYLIGCWSSPNMVVNLTNPFPNIGLDKPTSAYDYSYWASIRPYAETTPGVSISDLKAYTDGGTFPDTGWSALGGVATQYTQPTGTEGESGDVLDTTNYPTLEEAPVDIFGWTSGSPKAIDGSLANPDTGDIGTAGTDHCFLVIQLKASTNVAEGVSNTEDLTLRYTDDVPVLKTASIRGKVVLVPQTFYQGLSGALAVAGVAPKD